jgi:hypothetical protein
VWACPTFVSASFEERLEKPGSGPTARVAATVKLSWEDLMGRFPRKMSVQHVRNLWPEVAALVTRRCAGQREGATVVEWSKRGALDTRDLAIDWNTATSRRSRDKRGPYLRMPPFPQKFSSATA